MSDEKQYAPWAAEECPSCGAVHHPKEDCLPAFEEEPARQVGSPDIFLFDVLEEIFGPGEEVLPGIVIFTREPRS